MKKVVFLSDTHGYLDPQLNEYFAQADEIWHAGDIGNLEVVDELRNWQKPLRIVWGNIDSKEIRYEVPEFEVFDVEGLRFLLIHILGKPTKYTPQVQALVAEHHPKVILYGHSHRLLVKTNDDGIVLINPGAAGKQGFHAVRTAFFLTVESKKITNFELIKLGKK